MAEADDEGQKKNNKRDALRTTAAVPFSMFDPIVAFDAISGNWINVPEVAKLGIQAAHKKIGLAREERSELQRGMENLQKQLRGMQEHHVQQMNTTSSRVEFLERSTKRKKRYKGSNDGTSSRGIEVRPSSRGGGREVLLADVRRRSQLRNALDTNVNEESSDESSVQGVTTEQQEMLDKIPPLENQIAELQAGRRKELDRSDAFLKRLEKHQHQTELLENRLNDELSTRALSLLFRQLIFTELPTTLESFMADKFQGIKKLTDAVEKKLEGEIAVLAKKEHSIAKSVHGLANHLHDLEEEVRALAQRGSSSSSSEDSPSRALAREASSKLFSGSRSPRASQSLAVGERDQTPLHTEHKAPDLGGEDEEKRARAELLSGNGPPLDEMSPGASEALGPQSESAFFPRGGSASAPLSPKGESTGRSSRVSPGEGPESQCQEGLRLPQEIRKKRGSRLQNSSRTSPRTLRSQLSDLSDDIAEGANLLQQQNLAKTVEESVLNFVNGEKFICLVDQHLDLSNVKDSVKKHILQMPIFEAQQANFKQDLQHLSERLQSCMDATLELRGFFSEVQQKIDDRFVMMDKRLVSAEKFSERGLDAILASLEGRLLEFLAEGEAERARLWYQMSVLFPRFLQEHEDGKERMTLSEARAYALDVRLDHLEDYIVQRNGDEGTRGWSRPSKRRSTANGPSLRPPGSDDRTREAVASASDSAVDESQADGSSSPHRSASMLDPRSQPSLDPRRSTSFQPRFSLPPEPLKAAGNRRPSRLHDVLRHLQEELTLPPSPHVAPKGDEGVPPTLLVQASPARASVVTFADEKGDHEVAEEAAADRGTASDSALSEHFYGDTEPGVAGAPTFGLAQSSSTLEEATSLLFAAKGPEDDADEAAGSHSPDEERPNPASPDNSTARAWQSLSHEIPRSVRDALSDVMDETRNLQVGEVQLIRALNPRSPNAWLIGDAATGRVILGQDPPLPRPWLGLGRGRQHPTRRSRHLP